MIKLYVTLIKKGLRTLEQVPTRYREAVEAIVEGEGAENAD